MLPSLAVAMTTDTWHQRQMAPDSIHWFPSLGVVLPFHENLGLTTTTAMMEHLLEDPCTFLTGLVGLALQLVVDLLHDGIVL